MRRLLPSPLLQRGCCYGGLAYLIFFGTFLYAVGFVSGYVAPKTVDTGSTSSLMTALLVNLVLMSIFAVQHSGMARQGFKKLFTRFASPAIERSTYVLLASLSLILLYWQWQPMPMVVWNIEAPALASIATAGGFLGWLIVLYSTFLISHFELFGLTQVVSHYPAPDLSRLHHCFLVDTDDDAGPFAVRCGDDGLHFRRDLSRRARSGVDVRQ
jgi:protein-S-isoprenylcysteine O-methyltransferase Ste14